ncbi:S49 family peptidase [Aerophototrophica crusticola]|uniref:S49 family peptidase n=1 Tax=Aerophototrophica crusticola TaxID=1709002 RepID=A0A858R5L6_9PROT|nr:S49 family peptidase [Rhodospirillaceae bacterium B3]
MSIRSRLRKLFRRPARPLVTVLRLSGVIGAGVGPMRGGLCMESTAESIERAFAPDELKAVALVINSPGGSPVQSALIGNRIRALSVEKKVPVVAFVEDVAASGGYWLACAADEIIADAGSVVGSIGVISAGFGFQDLIAKLGVERRVYTAGRNKAMLDPFRPEREEDVERLKSLQLEIHQNFIDWVKSRRGDKLRADDDTLFTGEFWTGKRGLDLGLVDALGDVRTVMRARYGEKVRLALVETRKPWLARRFGLSGSSLGAEVASAVVSAAGERSLWGRYGL